MKPRVIVLGGCGFIGRNLVHTLIREDIAGEVRVVDKVPPQTAWLSETHRQSFDDSRVTFISANLINTDSCRTAFHRDDDEKWDWAVNCAGETRLGQTEAVYDQGVVTLSRNCSRQASENGVSAYVEISCCMASNKKIPNTESDARDPVGLIAKRKKLVEEDLCKMSGFKTFIIRPAIVYGPGDRTGLMPLVMMGAIYRKLGETMKMLWSRDVRSNTVHVQDVARAIVHVLTRSTISTDVEIYHVVDDSGSTQGSLCQLVGDIFGIEHSFYGTALSTLAKGDLEHVAEECNDKHLGPWAALCASHGVKNTPLTPFLAPDNLTKCHVNMDASKLAATGFRYIHPKLTKDALVQVIQEYAEMDLFPQTPIS